MKTTIYGAGIAVSQDEKGMDYVQVMPDDPHVGMVKPFSGRGYGQMQNNGTFDFIRQRRKRSKPTLKIGHISLSFGQDQIDRLYFQLPRSRRGEFEKLLRRDLKVLFDFIRLATTEL